ncbi:MAG: divergent polysaccharide deacetylase family protein [Desulfobulbaceae bacterium]|nr:divergent polysaccharide deacetylase family protein [Desulfobulbaceae bacterium]
MPKKKPARKKKGSNKKWRWFFILFLLFFSFGATFYLIFLQPGTTRKSPYSVPPPGEKNANSALVYEEPAGHPQPILTPGLFKIRPKPKTEARIAIIIDDMGYSDRIARQLIGLELPLSFAFLPFGPSTRQQMKLAADKKRDILLHLPMQPKGNKWDPGPGALLTTMNSRQITETFLRDLEAVPQAIGVNNHMGSLFTENAPAMRSCLLLLKEKNIFFVDSLTTANSQGFSIAKKLGIKTARRDIFLDNTLDKQEIQKQLDRLVRLARRQGFAIGIGHPHQETLNVLQQYQGAFIDGVKVLGISEFVQ